MKKLVAILLLIALVLTSLSGIAEEPETIKIGIMAALSSEEGVRQFNALLGIWLDAINTSSLGLNLPFHDVEGLPGLNGAKIEFVYGDASGTADEVMAEVERLITDEHVVAVTGQFGSASTKTSMVPAEKYGVPILSEGTSVTLLEQGYEYFFRTFPGDDTFVEQSFEFLKAMNETKNAGIKTVAIVSEDSEFGTSIHKLELAYAEKYGFEVVENIQYSATSANVTSEVLRLKQADPDVILMSSYINDLTLFVNTYKEQGYFPRMLLGQRGGFQSTDFTSSLGESANYALTTSRWASDYDKDISHALCEEFTARCDRVLTGDMLAITWNAMVICEAINEAGSTDGDAIVAQLRKGIAFNADQDPTGLPGYQYAENGQNQMTAAVVVQVSPDDHTYHTVYPFNAASLDVIYPAPGWTDR